KAHTGVHVLLPGAPETSEATRAAVAEFIRARSVREVIFTRGTTESINLVAACFGRTYLAAGDSILVSGMEHHSNIVPWQMICEERGAKLKVIPVDENGEWNLDGLDDLLKGVRLA